jgi:phage tail P2-like protein
MSDLLPINATRQERSLAQTTARISAVGCPVKDVWNAETCSAEVLPWLAWAVSVTTWNSGWTERQKRNVVAASIENHRIKGTVASVKEAAAAFGTIVVTEWWQTSPQGTPFTFTAKLSLPSISYDLQASIVDAVLSSKPARCSGVVAVVNNADLQMALGCYLRAATYTRFQATLN